MKHYHQHDTKKEFYIFQIRYAESLFAICLLCIKCVKITTCDSKNSRKISTLENMETTQFRRFPGWEKQICKKEIYPLSNPGFALPLILYQTLGLLIHVLNCIFTLIGAQLCTPYLKISTKLYFLSIFRIGTSFSNKQFSCVVWYLFSDTYRKTQT